MRIKTIFLFLIVVCVLVLIAFLFSLSRKKTQSSPLQPVSVRLNWFKQAQYAGMFVAVEKGFYKDAGLIVSFREYQDGLDQTEEVAQKKVDFAINTAVELLSGVNSGKKVKGIAVIYQTSPESFASLSVKKILTPNDWRGKILGAKGGNKEAVVLYNWLLTKFNIPVSTVTLKDLDYSLDEVQDLVQNRADVVDVYRTDQTRTLDTKGIQYNLITPETYGITAYGDTIITSDSLLVENPQLVQNFLNATLLGWQYALTHKDEAIKISEMYANKQYKDVQQETYIVDKSFPLIQRVSQAGVGGMSYITWNNLSKQMIDGGLLKKDFDVTAAYTTKFLNK